MVTDHDSSDNAISTTPHLSVEREPTIVTSVMPRGYEQFLGIIWFYEEDVELNIMIYRERLIEHLAYCGGLNLFWIVIL